MQISKQDVARALQGGTDVKSLIVKALFAAALSGGTLAYLRVSAIIANRPGNRSGGDVQRLEAALSAAIRDHGRKQTTVRLTNERADEATEQLLAFLRGVQSSKQEAKDAAEVVEQCRSAVERAKAERADARKAAAATIGITEEPGGENVLPFDFSQLGGGFDPSQFAAVLAVLAAQGKSDDEPEGTESVTNNPAGETVDEKVDKVQGENA